VAKISVPKHSEWKAVKKKYTVADGATKGVSVGKELDRYWAGTGTTPAEQAKLLTPLYAKLNEYLTKIDKKKVKKYAEFEKDFLKNYLGAVNFLLDDIKRYKPSRDLYQKELHKFMAAVQAFDKSKITKNDLDDFRQGPVRGLSALGSQSRGVDSSEIDKHLGTLSTGIPKIPADASKEDLAKYVDNILKIANKVADLAEAQDLL
jgi:hypothetical protein